MELIVNIDPGGNALHDKRCGYAKRRRETRLKGLARLKEDGGWLDVASMAEAESKAQGAANAGLNVNRDIRVCGFCRRKFGLMN